MGQFQLQNIGGSMCTKEEKREMIRFVAERLDITEETAEQAIKFAIEKVKADGKYLGPPSGDALIEEICANASLYGLPLGGKRIARITEASLGCVGRFSPIESVS